MFSLNSDICVLKSTGCLANTGRALGETDFLFSYSFIFTSSLYTDYTEAFLVLYDQHLVSLSRHSVQKALALWFCRVIQCGSSAWFFGLCEDSLSLLGSAVCSYTASMQPPPST